MVTTLIILHVIICILLTIVVLVQFGKGAEAGAIMGSSSSQAVFSSAGKGNFFTKLTTFLAICFMANSIALTTLTSSKSRESIFDNEAPVAPQLNQDAQEQAESAKNETKTEEPVKNEAKK